jgi:hypothetical protein
MADEGQKTRVVVAGVADGYPVEVEAFIYLRDLSRLVARLGELGLEAPPAPASAPQTNGSARSEGKPAELRQRPAYDGNGDACCPIHDRPLKEGKFGLFCPAKAEPPIGSDRGYCRYTWNDGD